jgi:hypothetical protein
MYTRIYHPGVFSVPGLYNDSAMPGDGLELLHDLDADPHMTENLIADRPDVAAEMRSRLEQWESEHVGSREAGGEDPLVEMAATDGPYLYVDPAELAATYRELDYSPEQVERVEDAARAFDRPAFPAE